MDDLAGLINKYGFPIIAAVGGGYFVYYVWVWATKEVKPVLSEANTVLIALIDRIRMLDNDLIRLNQKLNVVLQLRARELEREREQFEKRFDKDDHAFNGDETKNPGKTKVKVQEPSEDDHTAAAGEG
jgi:hypothetical protein